MASKKIIQGSEEFMMFSDFWKLYQKYYEPEDNQKYWNDLVEDTSKFYEMYMEFPMSKYMADGLVDYFEEKAKLKAK